MVSPANELAQRLLELLGPLGCEAVARHLQSTRGLGFAHLSINDDVYRGGKAFGVLLIKCKTGLFSSRCRWLWGLIVVDACIDDLRQRNTRLTLVTRKLGIGAQLGRSSCAVSPTVIAGIINPTHPPHVCSSFGKVATTTVHVLGTLWY